MARSLKKGPFVHYKLQRKVDVMNEGTKKSVIKTWSRSSLITPDFIGHTFAVHNGINLFRYMLQKIWWGINLENSHQQEHSKVIKLRNNHGSNS